MKNLLKKIWSKKFSILMMAGITLAASQFLSAEHLTAFASDSTALVDKLKDASTTDTTKWIIVAQGVLNTILMPILVIIGSLLDNTLIFDAGMEARLREIWIPIRNIVNILFVLVLVGIAIYNVLGLGDENGNYSLKTILPQIIIGIIAVNFSFLAVKVVLDTVNVLTVSVFALPNQLSEEVASIPPRDEEAKEEWASKICSTPSFNNGTICEDGTLTETGERLLDRYGQHTAALALATRMGKIIYYDKVDLTLETTDELFISAIFSIVLYLAYAISFVAMAIVLLARVVVMWLSVALSPVLLLIMAVPAIRDKIGAENLSQGFTKHAIAPLIMALALTIGWIMLDAFQSVTTISGNQLMGVVGKPIPVADIDFAQDLIVTIGTLAVVWVGVFAAADGTIAKGLVDGIKGVTQKVAAFAATAPIRYAAFIPTGLGGEYSTVSPAQIGQVATDLPGYIRKKSGQDKLYEYLLGGGSEGEKIAKGISRGDRSALGRTKESDYVDYWNDSRTTKDMKLNQIKYFRDSKDNLNDKDLVNILRDNGDNDKALAAIDRLMASRKSEASKASQNTTTNGASSTGTTTTPSTTSTPSSVQIDPSSFSADKPWVQRFFNQDKSNPDKITVANIGDLESAVEKMGKAVSQHIKANPSEKASDYKLETSSAKNKFSTIIENVKRTETDKSDDDIAKIIVDRFNSQIDSK